MAKRGRKPTPKVIRLLEGNPGRRPVLPDELDISPDLPARKPEAVAIDPVANEEWDRLMSVMPAHVYTAADIASLTIYVQSWSMFWRAQAELDENGLVLHEVITKVDSEGNESRSEKWKINPAMAAWRTAAENLHKTGDRLGLNPSVRARMGIPGKDETPADQAGPGGRARLIAR